MHPYTADLSSAFVAHLPRLQRTAQRILGDPAHAADVVQDVYLKAMEWTGGVAVKQPVAYLTQVARNLAIDARRRAALEARTFVDDRTALDLPGRAATPESETMNREDLRLVAETLAGLPERTRRAFELHRLGELTQSEIAGRLGVSTARVNGLVQEAVARCARALRRT
jgi:RNA polymerase sigma factor (sigma-70 family)